MRSMERTPSRTAIVAVTALMLATGLSSCIATFGPRGRRHGRDHDRDRDRQHSQYDRRDEDRGRGPGRIDWLSAIVRPLPPTSTSM
ncbi:MAG: hypothetical protein PHQ91_13205 [Thermoanaerobaculaceae bacterium]|nr:hypothetical protein [Thermoanaerobaculaceae bacterium]